MFSSRRFIVTLLIIAVFSAGLSPLVPNAAAMSCDDAMDQCSYYHDVARTLCEVFGDDSATCRWSVFEAISLCEYLLVTYCYTA